MRHLIEELSWRGLIYDKTPQVEKLLEKPISLYVGFDPTASSLHVGSLVPILMLVHFQKHAHRPIVIIGGATGMIGDPSEKALERNLLDEKTLEENIKGIRAQLEKFIDFDKDKALLVNNYDWMKEVSFLSFARDIGKHITVNYMISKDSVKKRLDPNAKEQGMSFTEFTYQLLQANDFLHLYQHENCLLQIGGSDQWGNITTGIELVRKKTAKKVHGITFPLTTRADGSKFGKTQQGENIWLDEKRTSPYKFYQFWLNLSDKEVESFIKIYTFLSKEQIKDLILSHQKEPHKRILQKTLAKEITTWIHGNQAYEKALKSSEAFFSKDIKELKMLSSEDLSLLFEGIPKVMIKKQELENGLPIIEALVVKGNFISSKAQARRDLVEESILVNKQKAFLELILTKEDLIAQSYILFQKGKKTYFILEAL